MPLPKVYRKTAPVVLTNFDFFNLATGRAIKILNGACENRYPGSDSSGAYYFLTEQDVASDPFYTKRAGFGAGSNVKVHNIDFDLPIEKSFIVEGDCLVVMPVAVKEGGSGGTTPTEPMCVLYKVDSNQTNILLGQASAAFLSQALGANEILGRVRTMRLDLPRTKFKRGDTLRLHTEIWASQNAQQIMIGHDPKNRRDTSNTPWPDIDSTLQVHLPVVQN